MGKRVQRTIMKNVRYPVGTQNDWILKWWVGIAKGFMLGLVY
jgi:hypothetical protein